MVQHAPLEAVDGGVDAIPRRDGLGVAGPHLLLASASASGPSI